MKPRIFRLNALTAAAVIAMSAGSLYAAPVVLTLAASTEASQPTPPGVSDPGSGDPLNYISSSSSDSSLTGSAYAYSFSNTGGAYAVSTNSEGATAAAKANASLLYTITNESAVAQSYSATFKIYGGSISTNLVYGATLDSLEYLRSSYAASITRGASTLFTSSASIDESSDGIVFNRAGTNLEPSDDGTDGYYSWGSQFVTLDLGVLGVGEHMELLASLMQASSSNVGTYDFGGGSGYGGYCGYNGYETAQGVAADTSMDECIGFKGNARGFYGDPAELTTNTGNELVITSRDANGVPEPGSLALMFAALGAAALAQRKRRLPS